MVASHFLSLEDAVLRLREIYESPWRSAQVGLAGLVFIGMGLVFSKLLIKMGQPVYAWLLPPDQRRYDVGNFESYFRTFIDFCLADERYGYLVRKYIKAKAYEL